MGGWVDVPETEDALSHLLPSFVCDFDEGVAGHFWEDENLGVWWVSGWVGCRSRRRFE